MVRIEGHELESVRLVGPIDDVDPDRLDAPPGHRDAKELPACRVVQHRHADFEVVSLLGDGRVQEPPRGRARRIRDHEPAKDEEVSDPHGNGLLGR